MANPKQKTSKSHTRSRRRNWKALPVTVSTCPQCHRTRRPHFACGHCGNYNGRVAIAREEETASQKAKS
ncbi:MAG: 50S ribosomal protein L32 [Candidatus Eremiobacteraeota bacterium]|nr:50S ribosomal protein L32 [Candidatus Eremiobacteraeota bacterium]MBC5826966.1 50S ribosomal protein L32 [Candidatus Eremiobacteraeota bacterium]